jgi:CBS domain-containing protein
MFGLFRFFAGGNFGGLWLAFIGWFLLDAARSSHAQVEVVERLRGVRVGDVMTRDCPRVDSKIDLQTFVNDYLLRSGQRCFIVEEDDHVAGLITPHEVKNIERERWPQTTIGDVMRPLKNLHSVTPSTSLNEALEIMGREDVNQLPVVSDRRLAGVISRGHIVRVIQTRAELQV